jgi:tRNA uridine 5-carboxymethylaminomethyl modification enzyme
VSREFARLSACVVHPAGVDPALLAKLGQPLPRETHAIELLRRPEVAYEDLRVVAAMDAVADTVADAAGETVAHPGVAAAAGDTHWSSDERLAEQVSLQVEVQAKYSGYLKRQADEIARQRRHEDLHLPPGIDYATVGGLSNEARQSLRDVRPATIGQAARIPGLTPATVSLLLVHLKKHDHAA